jgi:hypothetical protein
MLTGDDADIYEREIKSGLVITDLKLSDEFNSLKQKKSTWLLCSYKDLNYDSIIYESSGNGSVYEMKENFNSESILFGCFSLYIENFRKIIFMSFIGEDVNPFVRGKIGLHKQSVNNYFDCTIASISFSSRSDVSINNIVEMLEKFGFSEIEVQTDIEFKEIITNNKNNEQMVISKNNINIESDEFIPISNYVLSSNIINIEDKSLTKIINNIEKRDTIIKLLPIHILNEIIDNYDRIDDINVWYENNINSPFFNSKIPRLADIVILSSYIKSNNMFFLDFSKSNNGLNIIRKFLELLSTDQSNNIISRLYMLECLLLFSKSTIEFKSEVENEHMTIVNNNQYELSNLDNHIENAKLNPLATKSLNPVSNEVNKAVNNAVTKEVNNEVIKEGDVIDRPKVNPLVAMLSGRTNSVNNEVTKEVNNEIVKGQEIITKINPFDKYDKMKHCKIPDMAIRVQMKKDGFDDSKIDSYLPSTFIAKIEKKDIEKPNNDNVLSLIDSNIKMRGCFWDPIQTTDYDSTNIFNNSNIKVNNNNAEIKSNNNNILISKDNEETMLKSLSSLFNVIVKKKILTEEERLGQAVGAIGGVLKKGFTIIILILIILILFILNLFFNNRHFNIYGSKKV